MVTVHHAPSAAEFALWSRYPEAPFIAVSDTQAKLLAGLHVVGTIHHAVDTTVFAPRGQPEDYLLFLGRFTEGKGVREAIDIARRAGRRLLLGAARNEYYDRAVAPLVDGEDVIYVGELGTADKAPGVICRSIQSARVEADGELLYHLDGEIGRALGSISVRIRPKLLTVRVP